MKTERLVGYGEIMNFTSIINTLKQNDMFTCDRLYFGHDKFEYFKIIKNDAAKITLELKSTHRQDSYIYELGKNHDGSIINLDAPPHNFEFAYFIHRLDIAKGFGWYQLIVPDTLKILLKKR